jgi:hypothetical protein
LRVKRTSPYNNFAFRQTAADTRTNHQARESIAIERR